MSNINMASSLVASEPQIEVNSKVHQINININKNKNKNKNNTDEDNVGISDLNHKVDAGSAVQHDNITYNNNNNNNNINSKNNNTNNINNNGDNGVQGLHKHVEMAGSARSAHPRINQDSPPCTPSKGRLTRAATTTPGKRARAEISSAPPTPATPHGDANNGSLASVLHRLEALEEKYDTMEAQLVCQLADNKILREKCDKLEGLVAEVLSKATPFKGVEDGQFAEVLSSIGARVGALEAIEAGIGDRCGFINGVGGDSHSSSASPPPLEGIWQQKARTRSEGTKRMVAEEVARSIGRLTRQTRAVITGLSFSKDKPDEEVVESFLLKHEVTTSFKIFKKVKCRLEPAVTNIIVIDVGSMEERDQLLKKIKKKLRDTTIYINEDKAPEDLREEYMLRQEARDKNKNLSVEDRSKFRYAVRGKHVVDLGPASSYNVTTPRASSSISSSLGLGLGLGLADNSM